ncbi:MAG TPA: LppX_LprAFG lipoprotein [Streptosporangiaceae bacterium]|nr:LppX_LprAFG lipoprotein [Streptosporangiaceae bacterium]
MTSIPGSSRRPAAIGLSAAALALLAACSSGGSGSASSAQTSTGAAAASTGAESTASASTGSAGTPAARQALLDASTAAQQVNTAVTTMNVKITGSQPGTQTGTLQYQRKPSVLMSEDMHIVAQGGTTDIKMILTDTDVYFSEPGLSAKWTKLNRSSLSGPAAASFGKLIQTMQSNDFANQQQMLAAAKDVHQAGTQTIDGAQTTEYDGSIRASDAIKALSPGVRGILGPQLQTLGDSVISFREWIDGQHHVRRVIENETVKGNNLTTTMNITGINQPVQITLPPNSQVTGA